MDGEELPPFQDTLEVLSHNPLMPPKQLLCARKGFRIENLMVNKSKWCPA